MVIYESDSKHEARQPVRAPVASVAFAMRPARTYHRFRQSGSIAQVKSDSPSAI
jgi:hypothetical protein